MRVKIALITTRLLAEPVMVLIEQISATNVWTRGSSSLLLLLPWPTSPPSLLHSFPPSVISHPLFSGRWFWWAPTVNLKCFCWDYKHWGGDPAVWEGGTMDTERRRRPVGSVGGAVRDRRGGAREQCGLKQASMLRSFSYACLSLAISRPPCGENEAQNLNLQRFWLSLPDTNHASNMFTLWPGNCRLSFSLSWLQCSNTKISISWKPIRKSYRCKFGLHGNLRSADNRTTVCDTLRRNQHRRGPVSFLKMLRRNTSKFFLLSKKAVCDKGVTPYSATLTPLSLSILCPLADTYGLHYRASFFLSILPFVLVED